MKYSPKQEEELMSDIWTANIKDSPLNFVKYVFAWVKKEHPSKILKALESGKKKFYKTSLTTYKKTLEN